MDSKELFRKRCLKQLAREYKRGLIKRNFNVKSALSKILKIYKPKTLLVYLPFGNEANIWPLIKEQRRRRVLYVPFMEGVSFKMVPFRLPVKNGKYGIKQTNNSLRKINRVDMIFVPIVGMDCSFRRVGFGKGMYDYFYKNLRRESLLVFIQASMCVTKEIVTNNNDIKADIYISPFERYVSKRLNYVTREYSRRINCHS